MNGRSKVVELSKENEMRESWFEKKVEGRGRHPSSNPSRERSCFPGPTAREPRGPSKNALQIRKELVERVTVGSTSACRTILQSSLLVVFLVASDLVFRAWVPTRVHCSQQFLTAHSERSTWPATRRVDPPAVFIPMLRPLSNSLNCEKCLLARLPGMFCLPKSSYNRRVIVTFMNLRICAGLYSTLFLIIAPPWRV
ncbi:uncharacterized protein TNCV_2147081 [Trichonephila clavipes]|uniref:Uncharacterized protein n=1 Tax=Trichonephila clavipes TaxID=2585209 RepID=A0A8X6VSM1_TRICX|nr:uncharacterized protein TNCV_2147081 [Trichonephila clavipes]